MDMVELEDEELQKKKKLFPNPAKIKENKRLAKTDKILVTFSSKLKKKKNRDHTRKRKCVLRIK